MREFDLLDKKNIDAISKVITNNFLLCHASKEDLQIAGQYSDHSAKWYLMYVPGNEVKVHNCQKSPFYGKNELFPLSHGALSVESDKQMEKWFKLSIASMRSSHFMDRPIVVNTNSNKSTACNQMN